MALFALCAASLPIVLVANYALQPLIDASRRLPPGPRPLPVIGNLLDIGKNPHRSFSRLADRHGPLMSIRLGTVYSVVASSPEVAREILHKKNANLAARRSLDAWRVMGHHTNSMVALPPRGKWRALRQLCTAALLGPRRLDEQWVIREEEVDELVRRVAEADGTPVAVAREVFAVVVDVLCRGMFSEDLQRTLVRKLTDVADEAAVLSSAPNVSDFFPVLAAADLQGVRRKAEELVAWLYGLIDGQIELRRCSRATGEVSKNDMLDVLLDMEGEVQEEEWVMDQETIRALFMELLLAGSSIPTTIEWAMAELLQNPQSMKNLQKELRDILGTKPQMEESDINQLPYLQAIVKETLRLHPAVPFATGQAEAEIEIQGYNIPKGTAAFVNIWAICRNSEIWSEPEKFIPERFMQNEINFSGTDFELIPFSAGRRMCPGLPLASKLVPLMLGSLVHQFEWTVPEDVGRNGIDMTEKFGLVLSMAVPLNAIARKIQ